jgi:hypothetical protein
MLDGPFPDVAGMSTDASDDLFAFAAQPPPSAFGLVSTRDAWTAARSEQSAPSGAHHAPESVCASPAAERCSAPERRRVPSIGTAQSPLVPIGPAPSRPCRRAARG